MPSATFQPLIVRLLAFAAVLLPLSSSLTAQTGALLPNAPDLESGTEFTAAPTADQIDGVDLRRYFPPVGEQTMNDCATWAIFATNSCMEAFDQGWEPNRPATMFSHPQLGFHGLIVGDCRSVSPSLATATSHPSCWPRPAALATVRHAQRGTYRWYSTRPRSSQRRTPSGCSARKLAAYHR